MTFEQAATVFLDAGLLSQIDDEHGEDEERWLSLLAGQVGQAAGRQSHVPRCHGTGRSHSHHLSPQGDSA